ncbi:MAG: hypothetical protein FJ137_12275 [Deltaproteobacteria bacterium]|nr:hypothetical protein [Deltaproteobacteria bacterium]
MNRPDPHSPCCTAPATIAAVIVALSSLPALPSRAEGSAQFGGNGRLQSTTPLQVDIVDATTERVRWHGEGTLHVRSPTGIDVATLANDETTGSLAATGPGVYELTLSTHQNGTQTDPNLPGNANFDVAVVDESGAVVSTGRLFANLWNFVLGDRGQTRALDHSFFALVPGGAPGTDAVVEVDFAGLNGNSHTFAMNSTGANGRNDGRSSPASANEATPQFPLYVNAPAVSRGGSVTPNLSGLRFQTTTDGRACDTAAAGLGGFFVFETDAVGTAHVTCDLNGDGVASLSGLEDLNLLATTTVGTNAIAWDGLDPLGALVPPGAYRCEVFIAVGELHFLAVDVETSFPGMRMYDVGGGTKTPLRMYWDDSLLPFDDVAMPDGNVGLLTSGPDGVLSSPPGDPPVPNVSARAWGNFAANGKRGSDELTDTYTFSRASADALLDLDVLGADVDDDRDVLNNVDELCVTGTDPEDADSDEDGLTDGAEFAAGLDPNDADTDDDGLFDGTESGVTAPTPQTDVGAGTFVADQDPTTRTDPRDADTDDGGASDGAEDTNLDGRFDVGESNPVLGNGADDFDRDYDGVTNDEEATLGTDPDDPDSDDDGVRDGDERDRGEDTDRDGAKNALDPDSDDDGLLDGTELGVTSPGGGTNVGAGHFVPDSDPSTTTDPLDRDTDNGGVDDGLEDEDHDGAVDAGELDPLDPTDDRTRDRDGDGVTDVVEEATGTDPDDPDTDDDDLLDGVEDADRDGVVDDGETDPRDPDTDDDGLPDGVEDADHDGAVDDGETDPRDPDSDDDGLPDGVEDADRDGVRDDDETDPLDADSDDDTLTDGAEDADRDGAADDGETDPRDPDTDDDGVCDEPTVTIAGVCEPALDLDADGDGLGGLNDNCPDVANADQVDTDGDGIGDACDTDDAIDDLLDLTVQGSGILSCASTASSAEWWSLGALLVVLRRRRRAR